MVRTKQVEQAHPAGHSGSSAGGAMPLSSLARGHEARIVAVRGGRSFQARLLSMGLYPGVVIRMLHNPAHGPVVLAVRHSRIMVGRSWAGKLDVQTT